MQYLHQRGSKCTEPLCTESREPRLHHDETSLSSRLINDILTTNINRHIYKRRNRPIPQHATALWNGDDNHLAAAMGTNLQLLLPTEIWILKSTSGDGYFQIDHQDWPWNTLQEYRNSQNLFTLSPSNQVSSQLINEMPREKLTTHIYGNQPTPQHATAL